MLQLDAGIESLTSTNTIVSIIIFFYCEALDAISLGLASLATGSVLMKVDRDLMQLSREQALVILMAFNGGWYTCAITSFSLIEACKSWRVLSLISFTIPLVMLLLIR